MRALKAIYESRSLFENRVYEISSGFLFFVVVVAIARRQGDQRSAAVCRSRRRPCGVALKRTPCASAPPVSTSPSANFVRQR